MKCDKAQEYIVLMHYGELPDEDAVGLERHLGSCEDCRAEWSALQALEGHLALLPMDDPSPNRLAFDLQRVMRTPYRIDDFQQVYFVIPSLQALLDATLQDFAPIYDRLAQASDIPIEEILPGDEVITRGSQAYARAKA